MFSDVLLSNTDINENFIVVNGNCGDQIDHGAVAPLRMILDNNYNLNDSYKNVIDASLIESTERWLYKYSFGKHIQSIYQLAFLINFAVRWTDWECSSIFIYNQLPPKVHKAFYATQEFTDWVMNNLDYILYKNEPFNDKLYKRQFKKILNKIFGNQFDDYGKALSFFKVMPHDYESELTKKHIVATDGNNFYNFNLNKI